MSEHLELSFNTRLAQIIKWNSTASLTFPMKFFLHFSQYLYSSHSLDADWQITHAFYK